MDVSSMLSNGDPDASGAAEMRRQNHQYPTRHGSSGQDGQAAAKPPSSSGPRLARGANGAAAPAGYARGSPAKKDQKHVLFQLVDSQDSRLQARLPMRVMISKHDTTDSIIATVKNFYGLYDYGVSFENKEGITMIAAFDNFEHDMTIYVRTIPQPVHSANDLARDSASPKKPRLGAPFELRPHSHGANPSPSRSAARSAGARSASPQSDTGRRSAPAMPGVKPRPIRTRSKDNSVAGDLEGYSSGDNDNGSVTSSRRSKAEEIKADITTENIVEGGRRKRAFESSELPLFVPPQVPISTSISSISPQRRTVPHAGSPYAFSNQQTFSYTQPLPSPQSYGSAFNSTPVFPSNPYQNGIHAPSRQLRGGRASGASYSTNRNSHGVLPTPDPTIGSVISDEDVALQLMRLGDPTAFSHGRTSTSTVDDALSGKADAASSDEEDEEMEEEVRGSADSRPNIPPFFTDEAGPQRKKQRTMNTLPSDGTSGEEYEDHRDGTFGSDDVNVEDDQRKMGKPKSKVRNMGAPIGSSNKSGKPRAMSMTKPKKLSMSSSKMPMSPASLPTQSRKASISSTINFQHQLGADEEDLSSKPRCQRCRKSKKGCDRQRPCGRCKDAGIGIEGCISEDEGNGRKGRYGRHMGVTIRREGAVDDDDEDDAPLAHQHQHQHQHQHAFSQAHGVFLPPARPDKDKKRKR